MSLLPLAGQDGTLQSFSTVHERFNKSLGHGKPRSSCPRLHTYLVGSDEAFLFLGSINKKKEKKKKKKGLSYAELRLPAIIALASGGARH